MTDNAYIGIDLGTSGCRAIAIDQQSKIIASSQQALEIPDTTSSLSEQDPHYHWSVVKQVLADLIAQCQHYEIIRIAVDSTSGSVLIANSQGHPLTQILMYNDSRAIEQSRQIARVAPAESGAHGLTSGLAKLLYLQKYNDFSANNHLLHQADWINFKLGAPLGLSDENNALKSGYDPVSRCWPDWLNSLTNKALLPNVVAPGTVIGQLSDEICHDFNLTAPPKLVAGTTDSIAALLATGANKVGDAVTSLGSTLVVKLISDKPVFLPEHGVYSHRLGDKWLVGGASNTGGAVLKHFFDDEELQRLSSLISLDNGTPDYYPLLDKGERFPINNPNLAPRLTPRPSSDVEFLHGLLVGIAKIEHQAYQVLEQAGSAAVKSIRTVGGGAANPIWQTIRQQMIPVSFVTAEQTGAAFGAARLAQGSATTALKDTF